jgi:hypothetical protein
MAFTTAYSLCLYGQLALTTSLGKGARIWRTAADFITRPTRELQHLELSGKDNENAFAEAMSFC